MGASRLNDPAYRQVVDQLKSMRVDAGLSQRELARRLKVTHTLVSKSEGAERRVDPIEWVRWCAACGADPRAAIVEVQAWAPKVN